MQLQILFSHNCLDLVNYNLALMPVKEINTIIASTLHLFYRLYIAVAFCERQQGLHVGCFFFLFCNLMCQGVQQPCQPKNADLECL